MSKLTSMTFAAVLTAGTGLSAAKADQRGSPHR